MVWMCKAKMTGDWAASGMCKWFSMCESEYVWVRRQLSVPGV